MRIAHVGTAPYLEPAARRSPGSARRLLVPILSVLVLTGCGRPRTQREDIGSIVSALPPIVVNDSLSVYDRCTSCHRGVLDPNRTLDAQPMTAHPGRLLDIHSPLRFGCTPCHGGNGRATTARGAHAEGATRLGFLTSAATEISCGKCHVSEVELYGAPHLSRGRALLRRSQCDGCHVIGESARVGWAGPDLAGIADRTNPTWLFRWIKNPRDYAENARMPRYQLEDRYVDALVGYLMTFRQKASFDTTGFPQGVAERGKTLVRLSFCISCHAIDGKGGKDAIDLGRVGNKLTRAQMLRILFDTHGANLETPMPQYRLSPAQVADVVAYCGGDLTDPSFDAPDADSAITRVGTYWSDEAQRVDIGRRLFKELRCGNCHRFPGGEDWIRVAPILSRLGDKKPSELAWGTTRYPRRLADYVWHKVRTPLVYATTPHRYKMPTYDFTADEALDVTIAVLAQADLTVLPDRFVVRDSSEATLSLVGEFGRLVRRYRCLSCHSVRGVGHNISYDLGVEGSRVRQEWLYHYLKMPYTIRPILTVRMPIFNLTDEEARVLSQGIATSWRDAGIDSAGEFNPDRNDADAGRRLFERNGCIACHQVGATGGYVGPSFTGGTPVGRKLRRGWLVRWLEDPQAIKRDVLEPRFGFSQVEARQLAAYLETLGPGAQGEAP